MESNQKVILLFICILFVYFQISHFNYLIQDIMMLDIFSIALVIGLATAMPGRRQVASGAIGEWIPAGPTDGMILRSWYNNWGY